MWLISTHTMYRIHTSLLTNMIYAYPGICIRIYLFFHCCIVTYLHFQLTIMCDGSHHLISSRGVRGDIVPPENFEILNDAFWTPFYRKSDLFLFLDPARGGGGRDALAAPPPSVSATEKDWITRQSSSKIICTFFASLEVVCRGSETQLQVTENITRFQ